MTSGPDRVRRVLGAFVLMSAFKAAERKAENADEPQIVSANPRVERFADLAIELARVSDDDAECVRRLAASAKRRRDLRKAAAIVRLGGGAKESRVADRANRLLLAAATGESVRPPPAGLEPLFAQVEQLYAVPVDDAFSILTRLSPQLTALEQHWSTRSVEPGHIDEVWDELLASLRPVIGPEASPEVTDSLLRSDAAHNIARLFLALRIGLLDHIEYD